MKKLLKFLLILACVAAILVFVLRVIMIVTSRASTYDLTTVPAAQVALVPGAGITADDKPTLALRDRLDGAIALYKAGKVSKILMSGDNSSIFYNEPGVMTNYAI